jgi:predicted Zn finger-like uncharacterized protein
MAQEVLCPICGATYNLADEQMGKKVRCKKCEHAFTAGGDKKRREDDDYDDDDDGIQDAPRGRVKAKSRGRTDRGRDRDDDDDRPRKTRSVEEQAKPRGEREPGLPVSSFVIMGVVVGVLFLCCGGAGLIWWVWPSPRQNAPNNQPNRPNNPQNNQPNRPNNPPPGRRADANPPAPVPPPPPPPAGFPHPPGFPAPGTSSITSVKEALDALRGTDPGRERAGADWLARAPREEGKAAEVSKALDPLVRNAQPNVFGHDPPRQAALKALKVWGTKENVPTLVQFLQTESGNPGAPVHMPDQLRDAMSALARIDDEGGVEGILPWLGNFFVNDAAESALRQLGRKAEKGLLKSYNDPDEGKRNTVRRLLQQCDTKPEVILTQVAADLKMGDARRRQVAAEGLEKMPLVEAKRDEVSKALNFALDDTDGNVNTAGVRAAKTWGTKENVSALVRHVTEGGGFSTPLRVGAMEALVAIKDPEGVWPVARWLGDFFNHDSARKTIEQFGPVAEKVGLEHLKDTDGASRLRAWAVLSLVGTSANVATMETVAAKESDANIRTNATAAIRLAKLRR